MQEERFISMYQLIIFRTQTNTKTLNPISFGMFNVKLEKDQMITGPSRVFPGRLSVCRSFGDVEPKLEQFGGNPNVIIAEPEVNIIKLSDAHDFIVLGCKSIF